jgi:molecular chaperone GrpE
MTTPWSSQEPPVSAAGESEQDFPDGRGFDDAVEDRAGFDLTSEAEPALDPEQPVEDEIERLSARAQLADEYLLLAQRTQADFENYRKRAARDSALAQERGIAKLAKELLPAIDNLERAVQAALAYASAAAAATASDADNAIAADVGLAPGAQIVDGLKLVHAEVLAALGRAGIEPFSPIGEPFDPQHHEAVAQNRVEGTAPGTVIEVYQQGYRLGEAVLRPARVLVAA